MRGILPEMSREKRGNLPEMYRKRKRGDLPEMRHEKRGNLPASQKTWLLTPIRPHFCAANAAQQQGDLPEMHRDDKAIYLKRITKTRRFEKSKNLKVENSKK